MSARAESLRIRKRVSFRPWLVAVVLMLAAAVTYPLIRASMSPVEKPAVTSLTDGGFATKDAAEDLIRQAWGGSAVPFVHPHAVGELPRMGATERFDKAHAIGDFRGGTVKQSNDSEGRFHRGIPKRT